MPDKTISERHSFAAREKLSQTPEGRATLEILEGQNLKSYVITKRDSGDMARSYVADIVSFIDVANKENTRILGESTLL